MSTETIAKLNDLLRTTFIGGQIVMTSGIAELPPEVREDMSNNLSEVFVKGALNLSETEPDIGRQAKDSFPPSKKDRDNIISESVDGVKYFYILDKGTA